MSEAPRRRDLLTTAAFAMAGAGGVAALWPFVAALGPDQEMLARRVTLDLKELTGTKRLLLNVENKPVAIFRRTSEELLALQASWKSATAPGGQPFRDASSREPGWMSNWHRSLRPEIMIFDAMCTRGDCVLSELGRAEYKVICPCCGSRYDLAGRVLSGPAPNNLAVPSYRFVDETTVEFAGRDGSTPV